MAFAAPILAAAASAPKSSHSDASTDGNTQAGISPWYEGDVVIATNGSTAAGGVHQLPSITSLLPGAATAIGAPSLPPDPGALAVYGGSQVSGGIAAGLSPTLLLVGGVLVAVLLWKRAK